MTVTETGPTRAALNALSRAVRRSRELRKAADRRGELAEARRQDWLEAHEGGVAPSQIARACRVSVKLVSRELKKARDS